MKELIIKVDDPGERAWDGSPKTFEIQELVRCKDCVKRGFDDCPVNGWMPNKAIDDFYCADGEKKVK